MRGRQDGSTRIGGIADDQLINDVLYATAIVPDHADELDAVGDELLDELIKA